MDPQRFDSLAKTLGARLSRRGAIRAGVGAALGAVALAKLAPAVAQDPGTTYKDRFISIRTYPYTGPTGEAAAGLAGLVPLMEQQPGFISIDFVDDDDTIHVVAMFLDKSTAVAAAKQEDAWIEQNAASILSGRPGISSGPVFLRSELGTQCGCTTGVAHPCSSDDLICCPTAGVADGGSGICLTAATTCPAQGAPSSPSNAPTAPTAVPSCTSEGCGCIGGTDGACDGGLVCCADTPGGAGTCMTDAACNPPCTGEGCGCTAGTDGACDDGLECCGASEPGGSGTCLSDCGGGGCTGDGCGCTTGTDGACDEGLVCCGTGDPGGAGTCMASCGSSDPCPGGEGCACTGGAEDACDVGLECCGAAGPGGSGTCEVACG